MARGAEGDTRLCAPDRSQVLVRPFVRFLLRLWVPL